MRYASILELTWKKSLYSSALTLPLFAGLLLVVIYPYWPANFIGWVIVISTPILLEILCVGYLFYIDTKKIEGGQFSSSRLLEILMFVIPIALILIIGAMIFLDYIKEYYFVRL